MKEKNKGLGMASLVCSIVSLLIFLMPYFGLPLAVLSIVFAKKSNTGLANAGNIISIISIVINSMVLVFFLVFLALK